MLEELNIENIALIEKACLRFTRGFNVLSGETGAGKSILLGALGLLLGDRADKSLLRRGTEEAVVSALLRVDEGSDFQEWSDLYGISADEGSLILRRTLKENGRGGIWIQSQPVTAQALKDLADLLFDIHGQHQHQSLFRIENHRKLLDRYGGLEEEVKTLSDLFRQVKELREEIEQRLEKEETRLRDLELSRFALSEIEEAELVPGEEEQLIDKLKAMEQKENLLEDYKQFDHRINGEGALLSTLKNLLSLSRNLSVLDEQGTTMADRFENVYYELEDITDSYSQWMDRFDFSPAEQQQAEDRLALINRLEKKYAPTIDELIQYKEECQSFLDGEENQSKELDNMKNRRKQLEKDILQRAQILSGKRKKLAEELETKVVTHLRDLGMSSATFQISLRDRKNPGGQQVCGPYGSDQVEFLLSANRGEDCKPLRAVASGGELSRIMLALKSAFAEVDRIDTMIFDEIDTGIGGQVALSIGSHFRNLSRHKQIFCITHLASIASFADNHIKVIKEETTDRTLTSVRNLEDEDRVSEIARMLAGDSLGQQSLDHARELISRNSPE